MKAVLITLCLAEHGATIEREGSTVTVCQNDNDRTVVVDLPECSDQL